MPNFKAIFWDNDGTLVDTEHLYFEATKKALREAGFDLSMDYYINDHLAKDETTMGAMVTAGCSDEEILRVRRIRDGYYSEFLEEGVQVRPGVLECLELLKKDTFMAVVTSSPKDHFEIIMNKSGLAKYFKFFVTQDDVTKLKPNPEPYLQALERSGFKPEECLAIEDTPKGIKAAKLAGLTAYATPTTMTSSLDFSLADGVFDNVAEIFLPTTSTTTTESAA